MNNYKIAYISYNLNILPYIRLLVDLVVDKFDDNDY